MEWKYEIILREPMAPCELISLLWIDSLFTLTNVLYYHAWHPSIFNTPNKSTYLLFVLLNNTQLNWFRFNTPECVVLTRPTPFLLITLLTNRHDEWLPQSEIFQWIHSIGYIICIIGFNLFKYPFPYRLRTIIFILCKISDMMTPLSNCYYPNTRY